MKSKRLLALGLAVTAISAMALQTAFASGGILRKAADFEDAEVELQSDIPAEDCYFETPNKENYNAELVTVRKKLKVNAGEKFRTKVFLKNTGNMRWLSADSSCLGYKMFLGTDRTRDHESELYNQEDPNWAAPNRIKMDQRQVMPGEIASFTFWSYAPEDEDILKEYFTPVLEAHKWLDNAGFSMQVMAGDLDEDMSVLRKKMMYANSSGSVMDVPTEGEKTLVISLADQTAYLKIEDYVIHQSKISSGASATPTPLGEHEVLFKQEVRVGGKAPHYIMPNFMGLRIQGQRSFTGYGLHSLPSLGRPHGGVFWTEARSHIGIPVSHGCVRMLPEDSDFYFSLIDIGTKVKVVRNVSEDML